MCENHGKHDKPGKWANRILVSSYLDESWCGWTEMRENQGKQGKPVNKSLIPLYWLSAE